MNNPYRIKASMNKLIFTFIVVLTFLNSSSAQALTIQNKCKYPVAGSVTIAESKVSVAQFRLIPGQTKHFLNGFSKMQLIVRTIPDVYNLDKLKITSTEVSNPDSHIELKHSTEGVKYKVE